MLKRDSRAIAGIWAGLLAVAVLTAGCGGSNGAGGTGSRSPTPAAAGAGSGGSGGGSSFASAANCAQLKGLAQQFEHALSVDKANRANWQTVVSEFQSLANAAPGGLRPDLQVIAHALSTYAADIAKLHLKPGTTPSLSDVPKIYEALRVLAQPKVRAAGERAKAWVRANCG